MMIILDTAVNLYYYYFIYLSYVVSTTARGFGRTAITATSNNTVATTAITLGRHSTALNIANESSVEITNIRVHSKDRDSNGMIRVTMSLDVKTNSFNSSDPTVDTKSSSMMDTISRLNSSNSYSALSNATSPTISLSPSSSSSSSSSTSSTTSSSAMNTSSSMVNPSFQSKSRETTTTMTATRIQPTVDEAAAPLRLLNQICRRRRARVIVIGDVHGCIDELGDLLRLAEYQPGDLVLFLGDLVAKGPNSV